jgi:hypothetical protein
MIGGNRPDFPVNRALAETRKASVPRIQIGPKSAFSKVRTDFESGGKADARAGNEAVLSTIAAGVTDAATKPNPIES